MQYIMDIENFDDYFHFKKKNCNVKQGSISLSIIIMQTISNFCIAMNFIIKVSLYETSLVWDYRNSYLA